MCACRDDTDLITSLPPPPPHLKTPKRFLVTFRTLGFEAWRASSPRAGFSQGCQHPVFSAPSPSSPCALPSPCSSCLIPPPVTPTPDVVRVLFYVPAAPRPSARPTRSVFSHGLQVPNLNQIHQPLKPHVLPVAPGSLDLSTLRVRVVMPAPPASSPSDELPPVERRTAEQCAALTSGVV